MSTHAASPEARKRANLKWAAAKKALGLCPICGKNPRHFSDKTQRFSWRCGECLQRNAECQAERRRKRHVRSLYE